VETKTLKYLFDSGGLITAKVSPYRMSEDAWTLSVVLRSGEEKQVTRVRTSRPKIYKSLVAATNDVKKIGFNQAELNLN